MLDNFKGIIEAAYDTGTLVMVTHSGVFHADELACTALLNLFFEGTGVETRVIRTRDPKNIPPGDDVIIYDVFGGILDHHCKDEIKVDGRVLAAIGKLWRFGKEEFMERFQLNERMWTRLDKDILCGLDITDNTGNMNPLTYCINSLRNISREGEAWSNCLEVMTHLLKAALLDAKRLIEETERMQDLPVLTINGRKFKFSDRYCSGYVSSNKIDGIIWKTDSGTYGVRCFGDKVLKQKGISNGSVEGIVYVHSSGRNGEAVTLDDLKKIV